MEKFVTSDSVVCNLAAADKKQLLQALSALAAGVVPVTDHAIFDVLLERERLGTTGVGHGIAIPHGKVAGLKQVHGFFARLAAPVAFDAIDEQPVDLVFMLLAPTDAGGDHLKALAQVSRILRDQKMCERFRAARDNATLFGLLTEAQQAAEAAA
ncbi:MAG: PTS IIA-like nitrogen regulatory protein PtsN [Alphaproteobacteria bacterium]|nr:PTS IIA-like nitrogen regulatory protein PtsN [Alphaproteobacteria bacterium]